MATHLKKAVDKVVESHTDDPRVRRYGTHYRFSDSEVVIESVGSKKSWYRQIQELLGVNSMKRDGYDLIVTIGTAFDWEDIEPSIIALLENRHDFSEG